MGRSKISILVYFIIGFAVIGLISLLIREPGRLLVSILITIGIAVVLYFIITTVLNQRSQGANDEMKKYRKAVKQSQQKYRQKQNLNQTGQRNRRSPVVKTRKRRRHAPHLRVIEGKKASNDKDQASN